MKTLWAATIFCCFSFTVRSQDVAPTTAERHHRSDPSKIDIVRDNFGVPHIFAETDREVAYGFAWAHAEDDFETIQKAFLASRSMLGQYSGREGAAVDHVVHLLRLRQLVEHRYETDISPQFKAVLQGYCEGFNAYAETHPKEVLLKKFFPVIPEDLVTYSVLQLALGCGVEGALKKIYKGTAPLAEWEPTGSNAFAFNSRKTTDGNVYLNINTHHPLEGQVAWYEAHLSSEEGWNILGGLFPGSPVIFTGFNENLGWTHTVNRPDRLDIYQLEMNPNNGMEYKVDDKWLTLEESTVKLKIKVTPGFNLAVKRKTYWSIFGPTLITAKGVFSIRTAGLMDIRGLDQWYRMNKAQNFSEFKQALKMEALPSYNIVYGDRYDTIYYICNGKLPVRQRGFNWKSTLPGNTSKVLWTEFHPLEHLPQVLNPSSGYVYNANHSPFKATDEKDNIKQDDYDPTMGYETHDNNRSLRVKELMQQHEKVSYDDFKRIKYDMQLPQNLAFPVNIDSLFLFNENDHPEVAGLITALKTWDRKGTIDSKGAAVFGVVFYYIADKYDRDETFSLMTKPMCLEALIYAKEYMMKNFGTTDISLGEFQRLERGGKSLPLAGLPDMLATMYSKPSGNGRLRGTIGDCYIAFAKYTPAGPEIIETINCYGASNRKNSPHYNDQMELYQKQQTKKMTLNREEVYMNAKVIYHPEVMQIPVPDRLTRARR